MAAALYLDTSVALKATLEGGTTPEIEERIAAVLLTSRLSLVECEARTDGGRRQLSPCPSCSGRATQSGW